MPLIGSDLAACLALIDELVRLTSPPAGEREVTEQGLALVAQALKASGAALFPGPGTGAAGPVVWGRADLGDLAPVAERAVHASDVVEEDSRGAKRVIVPLRGPTGPAGVIVLEEAREWGPDARLFAASAA